MNLDALAPDAGDDQRFLAARSIVRGIYVVLALALLGLAGAAFVPLEGAIVASGEVIVKTHRKTIQHLEGGTIRDILVRDGQEVRPGQVLVRLDDSLARANLQVLQGEADALAAQEARLVAERDGSAQIVFPADLSTRGSDTQVVAAMRGERSAFRARQQSVEQQIHVLDQHSEENARTIEGLQSARAGLQKQAALIREELTGVEELYAQGYVPISRLLALRRQAADLEGQEGDITGKIAQTEAGSGANRLQGLSLRDQKLSDVVKDLRDVETRRFDTLDRLQAARETLRRTSLVAPEAGVVVGLVAHTPGAVIKPGETVMEIVPRHDALVVTARIRPEDADRVVAGMTARINFSSYRQRRLPIITGKVETMSADRLTDEHGQAYFSAVVTVDASALKNYPEGRLIPGMPAEVEINTGARTPLSYMTEPIAFLFRTGMREQ